MTNMRKSKTEPGAGLVSPPPLPVSSDAPVAGRKSTMLDFKQFKHNAQQQKKFVSVTPAPKDENSSTDDIVRKLDHLAREVNVTQKLICSKLDKMDQFLHSNTLSSSKSAASKSVGHVPPVMLESDKRFDKVRESVMKGRASLFAGRESTFKGRESIFKGRDAVPRLPEIQGSSEGSSQESPLSSPRSPTGPESFPEETDSSKDEDVSDTEPVSKQDSKGSNPPKPRQSQARNRDTVGTLGTETWRTWTSDNVRRSTLLSSKLSAISGRISAKWTSLISSYAITEAQTSGSIAEMVSLRATKQSRIAFIAWNFLDNPDSSWGARFYDTLEPYFLMFAALFSMLQTLPSPQSFWLSGLVCKAVDFCIDFCIMADLIIRYAASPTRGLAFFKKWLNVVDLLAAWPLIVRMFLFGVSQGWSDEPLLFCLVAIARLLKMMRRFQKIHLLLGAFELALEAMPVLFYVLALLTLTFSTAVYLVEPRDNFDTLPRSIYFTLVTVTSLGYGDYSPITTAGQFIASTLTICSAAYMAMPLGIIGSAFTSVWQDRDRILLMKKTRQAMQTWGFTADDIPMLFAFFDSNGRGALSLHDFREMIVAMRIGLSDKRVRELFKSFDKNGSGRVDDKEFVRQIFPQEFFEVFSASDIESSCTSPPSSGTLRVPERTSRSSKSIASEANGGGGSPISSACGSWSPVSSIPGSSRSGVLTRSLSVPTRSFSGGSFPAPFVNTIQRKPETEASDAPGFHSEPGPAERHSE